MTRRLLALVVVLSCFAAPALAHGTFVDARPLPGVTVGGVVDEVAFLFPEPIEPESAAIAVTGPEDRTIPVAGPVESPAPAVVRVAIEALTLPGEYRVDHAVISQDGFVFEGSFTFTYDPTAPPLDPLPYGRDPLPWPWLAAVAGALGVVVVVLRRRARQGDGH